MFRSQPQRKLYFGKIILGPQPKSWIKYHRSFASAEWFRSQVRYGKWIRERNKPHNFLIYVTVLEGIKSLNLLIKITHYPHGNINYNFDHVFVNHAHVLGRKKRVT